MDKKPWLSKTIITNALLAVLAFVPGGKEYVAAHPDMVMMGWAAVNIVLRLITKGKITIE